MPRTGDSRVWTVARAGGDIVFCTRENLQRIVDEKQSMALVWPEEGIFTPEGDWVFNAEHGPPHFEVYEPLLCDIQTASLLIDMYNKLSGKPMPQDHSLAGKTNKEVFDIRVAESRAYFGKFVDFCWTNARFK